MKIGAIVQLVVIALMVTAGAVVGKDIPADQQLTVYVELRNTAGILFGVVGIWIAVLYAPGLHELWSASREPEQEVQYEKVRPLLLPMAYCVVVLLGTVPASFIHAIATARPSLNTNVGQVASAGFMGLLVALQTLAVLFTVVPALDLRHKYQRWTDRRRRLNNMRP